MTQPISRPTPAPGQLLIGGKWVEDSSGGGMDVIDPSTGQVITTVADATTEDVDRAVAAARTAHDTGQWARTFPATGPVCCTASPTSSASTPPS